MAKILAGSVDALGELYDRYAVRAFRVARAVCHDEGAAEHAVQEAFVSIFKSHKTFRPQRGTVAAWVLMVVLSRAIDIARAEARFATRRASEKRFAAFSARDDLADQAGGCSDASRVLIGLTALPQAEREVIVLAQYGGLTQTEIAEGLGVPSGTVKDRLHLGMKTLIRDLGPAASL